MNSTLQCLAYTPQLTDYFLSKYVIHPNNTIEARITVGVFREELNPDNPLGMCGKIAQLFGTLLQHIWFDTSQGTSYMSHEFKSVLSHFVPQFSGYQ